MGIRIVLIVCCTIYLGTAILGLLMCTGLVPDIIQLYIAVFMFILYKVFWQYLRDEINSDF